MDFETKLKNDLPPGSYREDDHAESFAEMEIWGRQLDLIQEDNRRIAELRAPDIFSEEWQAEAWEAELGLVPAAGASLAERAAAIAARLQFNPSGKMSEIQDAAGAILGYTPTLITSPPAFWLRQKGGFTSESGHYLVDDSHKFAVWIVLDHTQTSKPYNVTPILVALRRLLGADCRNVGFWFDDNGSFDYNAFPPWPDGGDANITT